MIAVFWTALRHQQRSSKMNTHWNISWNSSSVSLSLFFFIIWKCYYLSVLQNVDNKCFNTSFFIESNNVKTVSIMHNIQGKWFCLVRLQFKPQMKTKIKELYLQKHENCESWFHYCHVFLQFLSTYLFQIICMVRRPKLVIYWSISFPYF